MDTDYPMLSKKSQASYENIGIILRELPKQGYSHVNNLYAVYFTITRNSDIVKGFFFNNSKNSDHLISVELLVDDEVRAIFDKQNLTSFNNMIRFFDDDFSISKFNNWVIRCWYDNNCIQHIKLFMLEVKKNYQTFIDDSPKTFNPTNFHKKLEIKNDCVIRLGDKISQIIPYNTSNKSCVIMSQMILDKILFKNITYDGSILIEVSLNDVSLFSFKLTEPLLEFKIQLLKFDIMKFRFIGINSYFGMIINGTSLTDKNSLEQELTLPFSHKKINLINEGERTIVKFLN